MSAPLHLTIPEPCHENWQNMTPNEQGRHCTACQKTVVDFSLMTDQEVLQYLSTTSHNVCGRFNNDQLNKTYREPITRRSFSWRYAWNMLVATFLVTGTAEARQGKKGIDSTKMRLSYLQLNINEMRMGKVAPIPLADVNIGGVIVDDSTGLPVSYATVRVRDRSTGIVADEKGLFYIPFVQAKAILVVSAVGYETQECAVSGAGVGGLRIRLKPEAATLQAVEIIAYGTMGKIVCTAGAIRTVRVDTLRQKIVREVNSWLPQKGIRVYPNPVMPGNTVNINLTLQKQGTYRMELLDGSGRLVYAQALQVNQPTQQVSLPTQTAWSRGVYWLRLSNGTDKKVYQAKVLLQ